MAAATGDGGCVLPVFMAYRQSSATVSTSLSHRCIAFVLSPTKSRYRAFIQAALPSLPDGLSAVRWLDVLDSDRHNHKLLQQTREVSASHHHHAAVLWAHAAAVEAGWNDGATAVLVFEDDARPSPHGWPVAAVIEGAIRRLVRHGGGQPESVVLRLGYNPWPRRPDGGLRSDCGCSLSEAGPPVGWILASKCNLRGAHAWGLHRAAFRSFLQRVNRSGSVRESIDLLLARRFRNLLAVPPAFVQEQGNKAADHVRNYCGFRKRCPAVGVHEARSRAVCTPT